MLRVGRGWVWEGDYIVGWGWGCMKVLVVVCDGWGMGGRKM